MARMIEWIEIKQGVLLFFTEGLCVVSIYFDKYIHTTDNDMGGVMVV